MTEPATATTGRSVSDRVLGVVTDGMTYRRLVYLLLRFPLGVAYFTTFATGLALGVALVPLGVGIPILAAVLGLADHVALGEEDGVRRSVRPRVTWEAARPTRTPPWPSPKTPGSAHRG